MEKLIDISIYPVANMLDLLFQDKSTKKNIIWATDTYEEYGEGFTDKVQLDANALYQTILCCDICDRQKRKWVDKVEEHRWNYTDSHGARSEC